MLRHRTETLAALALRCALAGESRQVVRLMLVIPAVDGRPLRAREEAKSWARPRLTDAARVKALAFSICLRVI